ncbi:hypothetical protein LTR78_003170 [Recurvomyces mirabilis]|uniref:O-methyltransferase C-terminal domain-containing protein n=1 Tax=Recurvomyces mirabilis TaxID=574656 RepID=A0AAE0WRZ2_9PEZI|nr:hypothetical protein LTR78_003170 [Recurvomyces mirabilis]KAK5157009.1 hypothetical protein LTS14_004526 [Recurvomyces mirabilis]
MTQSRSVSVSDALHNVQQALQADDGTSLAKHEEALDAIVKLQRAVERPDETVMRLRFSLLVPFVMRLAVEYGLVQDLAAANGETKAAADIATPGGADELLVLRVMRLITAHGICDEHGHGKYSANAVTEFLSRTPIIGGLKHLYDHATPILAKTSDLIHEKRLASLENVSTTASPLQEVWGAPMFSLLAINPTRKQNFDNYMQARLHPSIPKWFDIYDVRTELASATDVTSDMALLVDVGGGKGHDIAQFAERFPDLFGELVLQDLPQTFDSGLVASPDRVMIMGHDFFTDQPVKGARRYMMRQVLHDWSDEKCVEILRPIVAAMDPQSSRLLLVEEVLEEDNVSWLTASFDIVMWMFFNGIERTHKQWTALLG